jgi:hypothetical protein
MWSMHHVMAWHGMKTLARGSVCKNDSDDEDRCVGQHGIIELQGPLSTGQPPNAKSLSTKAPIPTHFVTV